MTRQLENLFLRLKNRHMLGLDLFIVSLVPLIALALRLDDLSDIPRYFEALSAFILIGLVWKFPIFFSFGLYQRFWRQASVEDMTAVALATVSTGILGVLFFFGIASPLDLLPSHLPRSIPFVDGILTALLVGGVRLLPRVLSERKREEAQRSGKLKRVLIAGAGIAGGLMVKEIRANRQINIEPMGFVDDDPSKQGMMIQGIRVLGRLDHIPEIVKSRSVDEVVIAMPSAGGGVVRSVVNSCHKAHIPSKTIPGMFEILHGTATVSEIREVRIEDLIGRDVVQTDLANVESIIRGKRVMVTGAGGSIGSELCRQILRLEPSTLILLGHGENSVFQIAGELRKARKAYGSVTVFESVIADLRDKRRMTEVFERTRPEIIFHAAAHKHVGLMEENMPDAISNNVLGTDIITNLSDIYHIERFVMISSDKAVNPATIMGVTKRIAEMIVALSARKTKRAFVSVRFGNVLGSRGSVVPIFKEQIARGGPITITDPEATRYFMTIPEAVQLILQSAGMGNGGDLFVLDMGKPIKIVDLARDMIRLSGLEEGVDLKIQFTGLVPGEKLHEELFYQEECQTRTEHEKILVCRNGKNGGAAYDSGNQEEKLFRQNLDELIALGRSGDEAECRSLLHTLVPQFDPMKDAAEHDIQVVSESKVGVGSRVGT